MNEVYRQEKKYFITVVDGQRLNALLRQVMIADTHNGASGYPIRSLYFDTPEDTDFFEKEEGVEQRRKLRLRCYSPDSDFAMLEMKQKQGMYQKKRSLRLTRADAKRLILGDYSPLLRQEEPFAAECYGLMHRLCYRPKTVVEYQRIAYIARENRIRVTLDHRIVANEANFDIFSSNLPLYPVLDPFNQVLEVKFNGFLLSYIKQLIDTADRSELSVSKYCLARSVGIH